MPNPVVHFEIGCRDAAKTSAFYTSLFGWPTTAYGPAHMIEAGGPQGIGGHITALGHEPHNYVLVYAQVDDIDKYIRRATELGGKLVLPATEVPGMGHFAWFTDPEGTTFGLWKPMRQG